MGQTIFWFSYSTDCILGVAECVVSLFTVKELTLFYYFVFIT